MSLYEELEWRGLIKDITSPDLKEKLNAGGLTFYIGTDPTADSMHVGHLSSFLISKRLKDAGHNPLLLIGGATGRIGDPRPSSEREMKSNDEIDKNIIGLTKQAKDIFGFEVVNNYDWSKDINFIDFLREYGKYFNINYMLDKDIIKRRLETGITYTEFSYMLMQAMDFYHLYKTRNCMLQVAGSDQWGNITAGVDLVKRKCGDEVYAFTMPLVTDSQGRKFGKSEGNALWLDKNKTTSYELYQFFINVEDSMVISYLKIFTFLTKEEIEELELSHQKAPEKREAHQALAKAVITFLHGESEYEKARKIALSLFNNDISNLSLDELQLAFREVESFTLDLSLDLTTNLLNNKIFNSKREINEFYNSASISINGNKINENITNLNDYLLYDSLLIIKKGKKKMYIGKK